MTGASEQTSLTHRVANPRIYAKGAIDAARWVVTKPPGLYAMKDMIGELNA
jgi:4-hydroxy-tetrahydrodipicolinate reductase